ncbi:MAG: amidohydrolase, partial [Cetobacterium sp.]
MKQILLKNAYIVSMNGKREIFNGGSILIEDNLIKAIGKVDSNLIKSDAEVYDVKGKIILPG